MNPETNNQPKESFLTPPEPKTPHPVNQVTTVSKYLALALFILLPFIGGYIGYVYAPEKVVEISQPIANLIVTQVADNKEVGLKEGIVAPLYYFISYDDVIDYMSSVEDPHLDWKNKAKDKLMVFEGVTFAESGILDDNEKYSLYFVETSETPYEIIFRRGSLIKGGEPIGTYVLSKSDNTLIERSSLNTSDLRIISCNQGTEDIVGLPLRVIEDTFDTFKGGYSDFMNDDFVKIHSEYSIKEKVGFHCVLDDSSIILSIFNGSVGNLSIVRIKDGVITDEALSPIEQFGSEAKILPDFNSTDISFTGHIIDPCYDLAQNFKFDLASFSLNLINVTGGDIPDCSANI